MRGRSPSDSAMGAAPLALAAPNENTARAASVSALDGALASSGRGSVTKLRRHASPAELKLSCASAPHGALPPVEAFWSLTMYDSRDYMLVDNPIGRYAIGDRTPALRHDADGGLTLHIQHARPEGEAAHANWLPAPAGDFYLCLRAYVPREEMLDGRYALPALVRTGEAV